MNTYQTLEIERQSGVAWVWLNRPEVRNAFNDQMIAELTAAFTELGQEDDVRVMVLAGRGPSFCAGADLNWMKKMSEYSFEENRADASKLASMLHALFTFPKPTIARVHGHAFAGGMGLVAACDVAVASNDTKFCLSEVKIGLIPATIGPYVVAAMGARIARRYMLSAERFDSSEALRSGFVHEVSSPETLDELVETILENFLAGGPHAHRETKLLIERIEASGLDQELIDDTAARIARVRATDEGREGIRSFLEKRRPGWLRDSGE